MISWIIKLCALCSMSALAQMIAGKEGVADALRVIGGLLMLKMTCEHASVLLAQLAQCTSLSQMFSLLVK